MPQPQPPTISDRMMRAFRAIIRGELPNLPYLGVFEYSIQRVASDGSSADASPTDTTLPLPSIVKIPLRSSLLGELVALSSAQVGQRCLVTFVNGDPSRPVLVGVDPSIPTSATIDASSLISLGKSAASVNIANGSLGAARTSDVVNAGYLVTDPTGLVKAVFPGTSAGFTSAQALVAANPGPPPYINYRFDAGTITGGSTKTVIG